MKSVYAEPGPGWADQVAHPGWVSRMKQDHLPGSFTSTYGRAAAQRKKAESRKAPAAPAEELVRAVVEVSAVPDLQLLAASATVSHGVLSQLKRLLLCSHVYLRIKADVGYFGCHKFFCLLKSSIRFHFEIEI